MSITASDCLREYFGALTSANPDALNRLIGTGMLLENPFMNPRRLVGKEEICRAHKAMLDNLEAIDFVAELLLGDERRAIAHGTLSVTRRDDKPRQFAVGAVVECDGDGLRRLSLYCDTRNVRRWSDEAIL